MIKAIGYKLPPSPADGSHAAWKRALTGVLINTDEQICQCKVVTNTGWLGNQHYSYEIHFDCCGIVGYDYVAYCKRNNIEISQLDLDPSDYRS